MLSMIPTDTLYIDKAVTVAHSGVISGQAPLPIPKGCKVLFGPLENPREISKWGLLPR